jgi:hypothetical protein
VLCTCRYCEEKFIQKYVPTIGVDYGVKPLKLGDYEVCSCVDFYRNTTTVVLVQPFECE